VLDQCVASQIADGIYDDAVERAPWLTADAERLKQHQSALRQSLQALRMLVSRRGGSSDSFAPRFHEFVELYMEHEAAEQDFLQAAFPGPAWALQS
jgi:capsule polysaccharide export protein KpsE/RkpR